MSKLNHQRPEIINKDNLRKSRQVFRTRDHELIGHGIDFHSPPTAHPKLDVTVVKLFKLIEMYLESFYALEKVKQKHSQGVPVAKRLAHSAEKFTERLDQLSLALTPIIADILLEILNKEKKGENSSLDWWKHTRRHIRLAKRFKLSASAEEKLFDYSVEKMMQNYLGSEQN
ncbi:hypothetical protein SPH72_05180 [Rhodobacterales bacterium FZCC0083]|nr:hypothetical protein SPH72_05180 [Rhodobacterales bacterium FZCC0083]